MLKVLNILILAAILTVPMVYSMDFGNIAVFPDENMNGTRDVSIAISDDNASEILLHSDGIIFWNLKPGLYWIYTKSTSDDILDSLQTAVYPHLTSKVITGLKNDRIVLMSNGFADQAGQLLIFDRQMLGNLTGELGDHIGLMAMTDDIGINRDDRSWYRRRDEVANSERNIYTFDNMALSGISRDIIFGFSGIVQPELALINLSDPFAGYPGSEVNLISGWRSKDRFTVESVYSPRQQRYHRASANINFPGNKGYIFGSAALDNLDDAHPRHNTDGVLPHNSLDGSEYLLGGKISLSKDYETDFRILYKKLSRDIYSRHYYFSPSHAPREEGYLYKGRLAISGRPAGDIIVEVGVGLEGDEYEHGSGVFFDDILSYFEYVPSYDDTYLFWSWDDIDGITDDIDESMVYDEYHRERSRRWSIDIAVKKLLNESTQLSLELLYNSSSFRRLNHLSPVDHDTNNVDYFGFSLYGQDINDKNGVMKIPHPEEWKGSLGFKKLAVDYFLTGSLDYYRFDPGYFAFKDARNPYGDDDVFDISDTREADISTNIGYRLAGGFMIQDNTTLFGNHAVQHFAPVYSYLYNGYKFLGYKFESLISYIFGNPELDMEESRSYEIGLQYKNDNDLITVSFRHKEISNYVLVRRLTDAIPASYLRYISPEGEGKYDSDTYFITYQRQGRNFLTWALAGGLVDSRFTDKALAGLVRLVPDNLDRKPSGAFWNTLTDAVSLDLSFLYKTGIRYTKGSPDYNPVSLVEADSASLGPIDGEKARDFLEINIGLSARLLDFDGGRLIVRAEIINVTNRENCRNVYPATGLPDETGWLQTVEGQAWQELFSEPHDSSGLNGEEKYRLVSDDPNNFGRPRMFRIIARLEF